MTNEERLNSFKTKALYTGISDMGDSFLKNEKEMCRASLMRIYENFRPLLIHTEQCTGNKSASDYNRHQQWLILYWMALWTTRRDYAARCLNYVNSDDFYRKISARYNAKSAAMIATTAQEQFAKLFDSWRNNAEYWRSMYIYTYHAKLDRKMWNMGKYKTGAEFRTTARTYLKQHSPADLWKVRLNARNIRNNIRKIASLQKTK